MLAHALILFLYPFGLKWTSDNLDTVSSKSISIFTDYKFIYRDKAMSDLQRLM